MTPNLDKTYLVRTKLHRPPLPPDLVRRDGSERPLGSDYSFPLTLVCAPAGYGKSTLVSQWLEESDVAAAWISLDDSDDNPRRFLEYIVAAVDQLYPGACPEIEAMLESDPLPPIEVLAGRLSNDLDGIDDRFVLVLDDFHRIRDHEIHEILNRVLDYPPRGMRLVIATRRSPSLSLSSLRGRRMVREVRLRDLRFTEEQTARFLERASHRSLRSTTVQRIHEETEGWPVALRLAALAMEGRDDSDAFIEGFREGGESLQEFFLNEILDKQSPEIRASLLQTAILQRFCAPLCDALHEPGVEVRPGQTPGSLLIQTLRDTAMPCVPLDDVHEWYRLHHLFQDMLERRLSAQLNNEQIRSLHRRAAQWLAENDFAEQAIHHHLKAGEPEQAGRVVARHRQRAVNAEQWTRVGAWIETLPPEILHGNAGLLMLQARLEEKRGRYANCVEIMDEAAALLADPEHGGTDHRLYQAWLDQQRGIFAYHFVQPDEAIRLAERALEHLPEDCTSERVYARLTLAVSRQMIGEEREGRRIIYDALERDGKLSSTAHGRLLQALCWINWLTGDLRALEQSGTSLIEVGARGGLQETMVHGQYFRGAALYHLNRLDEAEEFLTPPASDQFGPVFIMHMSSAMAMALIHEAGGRHALARDTTDTLSTHMLQTGNTSHLSYGQAQQAEIAMRQGRAAEAIQWVDGFETGQEIAGYHFISTDCIAARILVQLGGEARQSRAEELLNSLQKRFESTHNRHFSIEVRALRALFESERGHLDLAVEALTEAIEIAQPGGYIRPFVDLGPTVSRLLNRVGGDESTLTYIGQIQAAFRADRSQGEPTIRGAASMIVDETLEALSRRELEVLDLLAHHLTNKEIGGKLFISSETVKGHTKNIYQKLSVGSRKAAVAKAAGLGILGDA